MTESIVACCGLNCITCRAYLVTRKGDRASAAEIAALWSNQKEGNYKPEDVWCDGCHSDRLHAFCVKCPVRACTKERGLGNCGGCREYPCGKLKTLWESWIEASPLEARANLDRVRSGA